MSQEAVTLKPKATFARDLIDEVGKCASAFVKGITVGRAALLAGACLLVAFPPPSMQAAAADRFDLADRLARSAGGTLALPAGIYRVAKPLILPSGTTLECAAGAVLQRDQALVADSPVPLLGIGGSNIAVIGCEIDLASPAPSNLIVAMAPVTSTRHVTLRHLTLHGGAFSGLNYGSHGGTWTHVDVRIDDVRIDDFGWEGLVAEAVDGGSIEHATVTRTGSHLIVLRGVHRFSLRHSAASNRDRPRVVYAGPGGVGGRIVAAFVDFDPHCSGLTIADNSFDTDTAFDGIGLAEDGMTCPSDVLIARNRVRGAQAAGIDASCGSIVRDNVVEDARAECVLIALDYGGPLKGVRVVNNTCRNVGPVAFRFGHPIPMTMTMGTTAGSAQATLVPRAPTQDDVSSGLGDYPLATIFPGMTVAAESLAPGTIVAGYAGHGQTVTLSHPATVTGSRPGIAQGVTTYDDVVITRNLVEDTRSPPRTIAGLAAESIHQTYRNVHFLQNRLIGMPLATVTLPQGIDAPAASSGP